MESVSGALIDRARSGDETAFEQLVAPHRRELQLHCYRVLGSATDAEDAWLRMPPLPFEYQGRDQAARFFATVAFRHGRRERLLPTRANGQPAFGAYLRDSHTRVAHANGLFVVTIAGDRISAITRFDVGLMPRFGLPQTLAD